MSALIGYLKGCERTEGEGGVNRLEKVLTCMVASLFAYRFATHRTRDEQSQSRGQHDTPADGVAFARPQKIVLERTTEL